MGEQRVAIITGGASGIGKALAIQLANKDIFVIIADINETSGQELVNNIKNNNQLARFEYLDVTNAESVEELIIKIVNEFGRIDYMFNNAGIAMYGEVFDMSLDNWKHIIEINLLGVIYGTQLAYQFMKKQGFGHIINTASATGLGPAPLCTAYATTKHAIVGLTTSLHYEAEEYGVNVSVLCPTFVDTPIFEKSIAINMNKGQIIKQLKTNKPISADKFAEIALKAIHKNKLVICPMPFKKTMDVFFTLFPYLYKKLMRFICRIGRKAKMRQL
ncbi:SDR family NAD(P)-dependent oxidoreductase [Bacillus paranthracis]|uniref:SDR family NAD(P)-dependent oxidoreductase n=1 Tax=Bacillus paranthracis TaxID=2026186 RepID=UPI0024074E4C|nr:SDR family oxidoreductase [Bacillus paranthracis]MDF9513062.1 SDR family NAD(P)-dependent oxidoreductase [Bacillus paranthracis]MDF9670659.1 SDR family NAD(P)-dependent oxidoreductase [Bacillus paranthracis]MDG1610026.1 SDR family NAD(P)-dependent oxidoreductase [Bacillus paranthracis]